MSKEKQILQMLQDGYSQRRIASTLYVSRNTVAKVAKAASDHQLSKDALESMEEMEIHNTLFPECKNRYPSPICTQFEHHFHALKPHLLCHSF